MTRENEIVCSVVGWAKARLRAVPTILSQLGR
jgi:hypothetical protein